MFAAFAFVACGDSGTTPGASAYADGRLTARPGAPGDSAPIGLSFEALNPQTRPVAVYVPTTYRADRASPLMVLLHGSNGNGEEMARDFSAYAESHGVVLVAPSSVRYTWDRMATGQYNVDVQAIDAALSWAFEHLRIDPARVTLGGFSDGASYSILLGLKNGDLFSRVVSFAQCARIPDAPVGTPKIFIGHGRDDRVLPIDECSRILVPDLQLRGYNVTYVEYASPDGNGHYVTREVATQAFDWMSR